ncbi:glucose-1-phosphate thymidylyltransferase [Solitalea sp. MAHUQ-68]|uniref:Glucose-1-phosphate thymidylyltransferase n=1 Tax=Solitalea agri TaxID=2953739 RepID=A0A9X2JG63_9SPHI|nr:putative sugar nucleotidyl transferase [Solitalea agri]MCO4294116.1 glucose-1-phosphate thymidylyltransferase [Solitalea agri]
MRNYILFDDVDIRRQLLPLTFTRPIAELRVGVLTIREKWEHYLNQSISSFTEPYLQEKFPLVVAEENILINASVIPNAALIDQLKQLRKGESIVRNNILVARCVSKEQFSTANDIDEHKNEILSDFDSVQFPEDIFLLNDKELRNDFVAIAKNRSSAPIPAGTQVLGSDLFIEEGARINFAFINTQTGPVYIGKDVEIMEGAMIRGPFAACSGSVVKMGAKIYGATTLGPNTVVGGELKNCVFIANSNKGHEGYLGDSVIGEWCNLGADTNNSNLKNNFGNVKVWNYSKGQLRATDLQKHGVIMGDHVKTAINTVLNTGTVIGIGCNIATIGFPPKFVSDFSWLQGEVNAEFDFEKFCKGASMMMKTKKSEFNAIERCILEFVFTQTRTHKLF